MKTFNLFSPKIKEFVYQDISDIVEKLPFYVKYIAKAVTDIDATISKVTGAGHKKCGCANCVLRGGCMSCDRCPLKEKLPTIVEVEEPEPDQTQNDLETLTHFVTDMLKII